MAITAGLAFVACCLLAPAAIGAAWLLALGTVVEIVLIGVAVVFAFVTLRRHRARRCCQSSIPNRKESC